ncbi:unnamed protein product [Gongylonema pulchrum]|uniref:Transposase n=1 Tax=Gongylonema pulchrum TaxID=637853 RepID=A0A183EX83_9BILA|nr:unnamed protein product [Gongylonema pulchrum]
MLSAKRGITGWGGKPRRVNPGTARDRWQLMLRTIISRATCLLFLAVRAMTLEKKEPEKEALLKRHLRRYPLSNKLSLMNF